jgi:hypothetical protein
MEDDEQPRKLRYEDIQDEITSSSGIPKLPPLPSFPSVDEVGKAVDGDERRVSDYHESSRLRDLLDSDLFDFEDDESVELEYDHEFGSKRGGFKLGLLGAAIIGALLIVPGIGSYLAHRQNVLSPRMTVDVVSDHYSHTWQEGSTYTINAKTNENRMIKINPKGHYTKLESLDEDVSSGDKISFSKHYYDKDQNYRNFDVPAGNIKNLGGGNSEREKDWERSNTTSEKPDYKKDDRTYNSPRVTRSKKPFDFRDVDNCFERREIDNFFEHE